MDPRGTHDIYIDDIFAITINILGSDNVEHGQAAALNEIDATTCRIHPNKPTPHECMVAQDKLIAKAGLNKLMMILGWIF
jgi:hypothetical protein